MRPIDPAGLGTLTFDCYGTLIDWEAGLLAALRPLLARGGPALPDDAILALFQEVDAALCAGPWRPYRAVLEDAVAAFGQRLGIRVGPEDRGRLVASIPTWRPFPDTVRALRRLQRRYRLAIVSNIDDAVFAATAPQLGVAFDAVVTSEQARSYKPDPAIFEAALRRLAEPPRRIAHVAEGVTEIPAARRLGCATVWVRRHGRSARLLTEAPDLEVPDLDALLPHLGA